MIPENTLSSKPVRGAFLLPYSITRKSLVEDYEMGGIGLSDPSQGHRVQPWYGAWDKDTGDIFIQPFPDGIKTVVHNVADVFECSFAFDQNMRWMTVYTTRDGATKLRWFDSQAAAYVTTSFSGINSCRLTLDDTRAISILYGSTDVILTYLKDTGQLCCRVQRDRFGVEYVLEDELPINLRITNFGMNRAYRLQWRLAYRTFDELLPWL